MLPDQINWHGIPIEIRHTPGQCNMGESRWIITDEAYPILKKMKWHFTLEAHLSFFGEKPTGIMSVDVNWGILILA